MAGGYQGINSSFEGGGGAPGGFGGQHLLDHGRGFGLLLGRGVGDGELEKMAPLPNKRRGRLFVRIELLLKPANRLVQYCE